MITAIIAGIISSIIAIFIINLYSFSVKNFSHWRLKRILSFNGNKCLISGPVNFKLHEAGVIFPRTSFSFAYILNLLFPLKLEVNLIPYHKISEYDYYPSEICIGGPIAHKRAKNYIKKYLPTFVRLSETIKNDTQKKHGFKIGNDEFLDNPESEISFLIKIRINQKTTTHLFFGRTDEGTVASVHYFCENYKSIYKKYKKSSYCFAIMTEKAFGYKYAKFYKDYTNELRIENITVQLR